MNTVVIIITGVVIASMLIYLQHLMIKDIKEEVLQTLKEYLEKTNQKRRNKMNDREKTIKIWTSKIVYQCYDIVVNEDVWENLGADEKLPFIEKEIKHQVTLDDDEQVEEIEE